MKKVKVLNYSVRQLRLNKIDKLFYNTEGVMYADAGKFKEAAACFTKAIELAPKDSLSFFNRATVKINIGDILGARSDFALSESFQLSKSHLIKFGMN
jgi:Flp pilus assembly protein TadD